MSNWGVYGSAGDDIEVKDGDIWTAQKPGESIVHRFGCGDVTRFYRAGELFLPGVLDGDADVIHTDPPWTPQILRQFLKAATKDEDYIGFDNFVYDFCNVLKASCPQGLICLEMGNTYRDHFLNKLKEMGAQTHKQVDAYYGYPPTAYTFWVGSFNAVVAHAIDWHVPDTLKGTESTKFAATCVKPGQRFFDPCCGVATFGLAALRFNNYGISISGTELIPRKLANALMALMKLGYKLENVRTVDFTKLARE